MKWIKHHTNASDKSEKLGRLLESYGLARYGQYWLLLEGLGARFDGENEEIFISVHDAKSKLRTKTERKLIETLTVFSNCALLTFKKEQKFLMIHCPILFELQDKHSKYNRKRVVGRSYSATTEREEDKEEDKEEEREIEAKDNFTLMNISGPLAGIKNPDELLQHWNTEFMPKGYPPAPFDLGNISQQKFFQINKRLIANKSTWYEYLKRIDDSEFLTKKKAGGKPGLVWLLEETNFDKVYSGNFDIGSGNDHRVDKYIEELKAKLA